VLSNAQLGNDGNPLKGLGGRFVKVHLRGYAVMEKRAAPIIRRTRATANGNTGSSSDKTPNEKANLGVCFECRKPQATHHLAYSYDNLKTAAYK